MSTGDDLTGLHARATFLHRLTDGMAAAGIGHYPLCLLLVDLDYLKSINDQYGHLAGDAALRAVSGVLRAVLRADDVAGRYGGDEFVAFLPATTREEGIAVAERVRAAMAAVPRALQGAPAPLHLTLSIGVATFPRDGDDPTALFAAADRGVYAAKAAGRDCVRSVPSDGAEQPPAPPAQLRGGRLVGRQAELHRIRILAEAACQGSGRLVVVEGEAGIGKTRLIMEVVQSARLLGLRVLDARCHQVEIASPYYPMLTALAPIASAAPVDWLQHITGVWAGELARLFPVLRERLPHAEPLPVLPSDEDRARLQQALCELLIGVAQAPTLLLVDDLHWADEASIRVLHRLAWQIDNISLLVVCTLRTEDLPDNPPLAAALAALQRQGRYEQVVLTPLSKGEANTLLRTALGLRWVPDALHHWLIDGTGGNPLFLLETLRLLIERQILQEEDGQWRAVPPPDQQGSAALPVAATVQAVIEARMARLSAAQRDIMAAAAAYGQRFDPDVLVSLVSGAEDDRAAAEDAVWSAMETLEQQRLAVPDADGAGAYEFAHPLIRQVAYQAAGVARRRALHRKIAALLDMRGASPSEIAEHHWQGGDPGRALDLFVRAAEAATAIHAPRSAIGYYERALAAAGRLPATGGAGDRARLYERLGDLRDLDGDWHRAVPAYQDALALSTEDAAARAGLWCKIGDLCARQSDHERALAAYDAAAGAADGADLPAPLQATILLGRARVQELRAAYVDAARLARTAHELLVAYGHSDLDLRRRAVEMLGTVTHRQGDLAAAEAWFARGLRDAEAGGATRWVAHYSRHLALIRWQRGDLAAGERWLHRALDLAERIGDQSLQAYCRRTRGVWLAVHGHSAEAAEWYRRALEIFERSGDRQGAATIHHNLGILAEVAGDYGAADASFQQSLAIHEEGSFLRGVATVLNSRGRVALDRGDFPAALRTLQRSLAVNEEVGDPTVLGHCLYLLALVCHERGDEAASTHWRARVRALPGADPEDLLNTDLLDVRALLLSGRIVEARAAAHVVAQRIEALHMVGPAVDACLLLAEVALRAAALPAAPITAELAGQAGWAAAREAADQALARARREGSRIQVGRALCLLGQASMDRDEARRLLLEALAVFDEIGACVEAARTRSALALHPAQPCAGDQECLLAEARASLEAAGAHADIILLGAPNSAVLDDGRPRTMAAQPSA